MTEARFDTRRSWPAVLHHFPRTSIVLLLALAISLCSCSRGPQRIALPSTVTTVVAGYPFALQIKKQMGGDAHLMTVVVDLDRQGGQFNVSRILYGFASPKANGRVFAIAVDNLHHEAVTALDVPVSPDSPHMSSPRSATLDLAGIRQDIAGVLQIARKNGLDEFCALSSPKQGNVDLNLSMSPTGPVWGVIGDAWDEKGPIADLAISIDARTGAVLKHTLQKAAHRP